MGRNFVFGCVLVFFTQNQVPQLIIGNSRVMYKIEALSAVIRANFKKVQKIVLASRKTGFTFLSSISFNFERVMRSSNFRYLEIYYF